ncbi:hypothetical protein CEY04_11895 [Achromobacter sp. HZ28]|nr:MULTISPECIES: NYN domain-containing protein [unclassified Achromobacter]OWT73428.1 hypothetical protein CEY05_20085 [Achromobacter sp. HZ34]OWT79654.1 hypothetical protein CEY04_11895 [Achromobacter sp. HZ28]
MVASHENVSMALFCDFENVALGVRDANYEKLDIRLVLEKLLLKGSIVIKKAYCDWDRYKGFKAAMHEANFELIEIPHVRQSGKNSADIRLVVDALDLCYTKSHLDTFVIISGDSDFSPLVSKLRENAKYVIGVGVKQSTSDLLIANCDEFIFYDDLVRETQRSAARRDGRDNNATPRRSPEDERRRKEEVDARRSKAIELATETFDALVAERGDSGKIWASALKDAIKRRKPDFNESYYGFRAFGNLLEEARARGLLEIGRDEKSGTFVYRTAGTGEGAGGESDAQPPRQDGRRSGRERGTGDARRDDTRNDRGSAARGQRGSEQDQDDVRNEGDADEQGTSVDAGRADTAREGQRSRGRGRGERGRRSGRQADVSAPQLPAGDGDSANAAAAAGASSSDNYNDNGYIYSTDSDSDYVGQNEALQSADAPTDTTPASDPAPVAQETEAKDNRKRHPVPARTAKAAAKKAAQEAARQSGSGNPFVSSPFTPPPFTSSSAPLPFSGSSSSSSSSPFRDDAPWDDARADSGVAADHAQPGTAGNAEAGDAGQEPAMKTSSNRRGTGRRSPAGKKAAGRATDTAGSDSVRNDGPAIDAVATAAAGTRGSAAKAAGTDAAQAGDAVDNGATRRAPANRRSPRKTAPASAASTATDQAPPSDPATSPTDTPAAAKRAPRKTATRARRPRKDDEA